ncbi:response regulator [Crocosphaera sp. Alani8]|uniref:response regulator n=1 Tax=Crocosphaera sp. Alani8 TaxID=3038952 RepID=UPI00313C9DCE
MKSYRELPVSSNEILPKFSPTDILAKISAAKATGCLIVSYNSVTWIIYFYSGDLIYAHHSLNSFGRLERHLRRFSYRIPTLTGSVRDQVRLRFENENQINQEFPCEYQAISWLVENEFLEPSEAKKLLVSLNKEVFESFLLLKSANCRFIQKPDFSLKLSHLDTDKFLMACQKKIEDWQALAPLISSPEQRPYFFTKNKSGGQMSAENIEKFSKLLRGFSFRQLSVITNQDEIKIAQHIYKYIHNKIVILREPQSPFDKLPQFKGDKKSGQYLPTEKNSITLHSVKKTKTYKLVCVDDSPTILKEISRFLDNKKFKIKAITESKKALLEIIRFKPDIILLDVGMPGIDGYQLCKLIRNHPLFKETPIIMVTGNKGLIDRAKARVAGSSDYLTKPFTQSDLLNMVIRYLN